MMPSRRTKTQREKSERPSWARKLYMPSAIACCLFLIYFSILTVKAFRTSPTLTKQAITESRHESIAYDYRVYPSPCILFPAGSEALPPEQGSYFSNITQRIEFEVKGQIQLSSLLLPEGQLQIQLLVRSEGQWEKELDVHPKVTEEVLDDGKLALSSSFSLPINEATRVGEAIVEQLGVRPRDSYLLVVRSTLGDTPDLKEPLVAEYVFALKGRTIEPSGKLFHERRLDTKEAAQETNQVCLLGYCPVVSTARALAPFMIVVSGIGLCCSAFSVYKDRFENRDESLIELQRIRRRYGGRIVGVTGFTDIPKTRLTITVDSFTDLAKLADERERPILQHIDDQNPELTCARFYVTDEDTLYTHTIAIGRRKAQPGGS